VPTGRNEHEGVDRRLFLALLGATAAGAGLSGCNRSHASVLADRRQLAFDARVDAARMALDRGVPPIAPNGDEFSLPGRIANFSKGLAHDARGEVVPSSYDALLSALGSGDPAAFDAIPMAGARRLVSPQAGLAFDLEGPDSHACAFVPAPAFASAEWAGELVELYWMALLRDVHFEEYAGHPDVAAAGAELSALSDFRGPKAGGAVTPATLFRGSSAGDLVGPYVSQFLLKEIAYGALRIPQQMRTVQPGSDYLTEFSVWLAAQHGAAVPPYALDPVPRYPRNLRDMAEWVHVDALYQAYLDACLILLAAGAPFDPGNPYVGSTTQDGFATFGAPHILSLVTEVATRALKAVWFQKWFVHRRLRPEEAGGRVHVHATGGASYPIHGDLLGSAALGRVFSAHGSYLLPQAYPEGSPLHPSYGAGHAAVAGACVTVLKAWFDEGHVLTDPVVPSPDGTTLLPYAGPPLTVGGELDKLASNIALARSAAGIHWRSDYRESVRLGETVALGILEEQKRTYNEPHSFGLTRFDGTTFTI